MINFLFECLDNARGICFINYKTKDYFLEGAGLLNLSVNTLNEKKSHDLQLFLDDTHYNREDYHRKHQDGAPRPSYLP